MKFPENILAQTLLKLCLEKDIRHIVISPGSRNAPLTIGFSENPEFQCFSVVDERSAAFVAMGMAQQLKKPVAVLCTSGSAVLNYYPAVAEAYYSDIPLIVLSADRPAHLIDIGDGQTIRQENVLEKHVLFSASCKTGPDTVEKNEKLINLALNTALEQKGPVHINLPFAEPLYTTVQTSVIPENIQPDEKTQEYSEDLTSFAEKWNRSSKKMILVGTVPPGSIKQEFIDFLATDESVLFLTETTSNLHHSNLFSSIDQLIAPFSKSEFREIQPEILLTFGGMVVSKKIKSFLREFPPKEHWHIDFKTAYDTYFVLSHHFKTSPNSFFSAFLPLIEPGQSSYQKTGLTLKSYRENRHEKYLRQIPYSDLKVFSEIFKYLPGHCQIQLSNSTPIRYSQFFKIPEENEVFCNRGTSGIDGSVSTAVGAAITAKLPVVLLTGDLSFFYDSNGLWNSHIPDDFKIIIVNNQGGGIFRILPGEKDSYNFDTFFETRHHLQASHLAAMYGFSYRAVHKEEELEESLQNFFRENKNPAILEIFTPAKVNDAVLLNYFEFLK